MRPGPGEALAVGFEGTALPDAVRDLAPRSGLGGIVLFARNCPTLEAVLALTGAARALDPDLLVLLDHEGRGLKSQMKKADKLGARFVAIRGEDERKKDVWVIRDMAGSSQEEVPAAAVARHLEGRLRG